MAIHGTPFEGAARALQRGDRTPRAYADELLERVAAVDPEVEALIPEPDRARRLRGVVAALEERVPGWRRPPLYGVPVGVKDIVHVDGLPTRAGSTLPPDVLAGNRARVVSRLREAGELVLGKTVTTEFAYYEPGPTRNPHDPTRAWNARGRDRVEAPPNGSSAAAWQRV